MYYTITLSNSDKVAVVDERDHPRLSAHKWHLTNQGYAARTARIKGKRITILMHRLICPAYPNLIVAHKDGCKLNNTRSNLVCRTQAQCAASSGMYKSNTTGYRGVSLTSGPVRRYEAYAHIDRVKIYLGRFDTAQEAAEAYNAHQRKRFGALAYQNPIEEIETGTER